MPSDVPSNPLLAQVDVWIRQVVREAVHEALSSGGKSDPAEDDLLTLAEASREFGLPKRRISEGVQMKYGRGRATRVPRSAVRALVESTRQPDRVEPTTAAPASKVASRADAKKPVAVFDLESYMARPAANGANAARGA